CAIELGEDSVELEPSGDYLTIGLITGPGCTITAMDDAMWLFTNLEPATATVSANENVGGPRRRTVTVTAEETGATATVDVRQATSLPLPVILAQPMSERAYVGESITLTIEVEDEAASFQWRKDGRDIPGETGSSLELARLELDDAGS